MPPNVPAERVDAIRRAFDATMKDPEFLAEADKLKIEIDPLTGEQVAALIEEIYKTPADDRGARARRDGAEVGDTFRDRPQPSCAGTRSDASRSMGCENDARILETRPSRRSQR